MGLSIWDVFCSSFFGYPPQLCGFLPKLELAEEQMSQCVNIPWSSPSLIQHTHVALFLKAVLIFALVFVGVFFIAHISFLVLIVCLSLNLFSLMPTFLSLSSSPAPTSFLTGDCNGATFYPLLLIDCLVYSISPSSSSSDHYFPLWVCKRNVDRKLFLLLIDGAGCGSPGLYLTHQIGFITHIIIIVIIISISMAIICSKSFGALISGDFSVGGTIVTQWRKVVPERKGGVTTTNFLLSQRKWANWPC